jgi:hypothetical protein
MKNQNQNITSEKNENQTIIFEPIAPHPQSMLIFRISPLSRFGKL